MNLAYERYDIVHVKISSNHDNIHNNNVNYDLKSSKDNELNT